jgi:hypothetical protein
MGKNTFVQAQTLNLNSVGNAHHSLSWPWSLRDRRRCWCFFGVVPGNKMVCGMLRKKLRILEEIMQAPIAMAPR